MHNLGRMRGHKLASQSEAFVTIDNLCNVAKYGLLIEILLHT